jgi:hypothetical protein
MGTLVLADICPGGSRLGVSFYKDTQISRELQRIQLSS